MSERLAGHFGPEGLRAINESEMQGLALSAPSAHQLATFGIPLQVGPYFRATAGEPMALGEYASTAGFPDAASDSSAWCRLGTDHGAELCVTPSETVQAVFVTTEAPTMHVNRDVGAFTASLLELDRYLPILAAPGDEDAAAVFRRFRGRLREIDETALGQDEAWWPRVLEDIRHAMSFPFAAAFEIEGDQGGSRIETEVVRPGGRHPERVLWERLKAQGVRPGQIRRVHTDLQPCILPGNYCATWITRFPNADRTYNFDYGDTAPGREAGLLALMNHAIAQAR